MDDSRRHASPNDSSGRVIEADPADIVIRPLASLAEYQACVALQAAVWGPAYEETVPASLLQVVQHVGGVAIGAFAVTGELVGFVFGLTGVDKGEIVHWSHALGVRETVRNRGIGRMLKEHQRATLAQRGIASMYWTFDPLVAKNAHLNLNQLGARVVEYVPNMYGTTGSPLHYGLATDRLVVVCRTHPAPGRRGPAAAPASGRPVLTPEPQSGDQLFDAGTTRPPTVWIEVPTDIQQVIEQSRATAAAWRAALRTHFEWALRSGYAVTGLHRDPVTSRSFYALTSASAPT